jgi:predicted nucleic acid-binding protein
LGRLGLLHSLFGKITITRIIANEYGNPLPDYIEIENPVNETYQRILEGFLDQGEASAIALALEKENPLLIIDEYKGRKEAKHLKINHTGTMGIFIVAKERGLITSMNEIIDEIRKTNFRISETLIEEVLKQSRE